MKLFSRPNPSDHRDIDKQRPPPPLPPPPRPRHSSLPITPSPPPDHLRYTSRDRLDPRRQSSDPRRNDSKKPISPPISRETLTAGTRAERLQTGARRSESLLLRRDNPPRSRPPRPSRERERERHRSDLPAPVSPNSPTSTPRRPRLRHAMPPLMMGWAGVRPAKDRKVDLRFVTLAGPILRYSISPSQPILSGSIMVYGGHISTEEFGLRIQIRSPDGKQKLSIFPENRTEHQKWRRELVRASKRALTDDYEFRQDIRSTPFGKTSVAKDRKTAHLFKVKVTSKTSLSDYHVQIARKESVILLSIPEHRNIISIVDMYESARTLYMVSEYTPGQKTLSEMLAEPGTIRETDVATIIHGLLKAIKHLHAHSVTHRFICPDNIHIVSGPAPTSRNSRTPRTVITLARLCNFELALSHSDMDAAVSVLDSFSKTGPLRLHHAGYLAPEVASGRIGTYSQDIWSVGIIMHQLLVGVTPFGNGMPHLSDFTKVISVSRGAPSFAGPMWRGISSGARNLCAKLLHADPGRRYTASQALEHPWLNI